MSLEADAVLIEIMLTELKVDHSAEEAITQIKEKNYMVRFTGKDAKNEKKVERILLVGIGYDKQTKKHKCKIEEQKLV